MIWVVVLATALFLYFLGFFTREIIEWVSDQIDQELFDQEHEEMVRTMRNMGR